MIKVNKSCGRNGFVWVSLDTFHILEPYPRFLQRCNSKFPKILKYSNFYNEFSIIYRIIYSV